MSAGPVGSFLREHPDGCSLAVRVQPGAKKTVISGVYGEGDEAQLKIAVKAPPVEGRANEALVAFLAEVFGVSRTSIAVAHGQSGRSKLVIVKTAKAAAARGRILEILEHCLTGGKTGVP